MVQGALRMPTSLQDAWTLTSQTVGNVIAGAAVFALFWLLARLIRNLVSRAMARRSIRSDAALLTTRAVYVGVIGLGGFMFVALSLGSGIVGVTGVLVAAVLTSLGLQDLVKNYVSGFYVLMEKNVRVGDLVESGGYRGLVTDIRMRVTYLRGARGEMIVVPNGELFNRTLVISAAPPDWASGPEGTQHDSDEGVEVVAH
jgi:small conductance mechanosensitive channel